MDKSCIEFGIKAKFAPKKPMNIQKVLNHQRLLKALVGVNKNQFYTLLAKFNVVLEEMSYQKVRKRARGGGRKHTLRTPKEKLFYILFYMKNYPTFDLAAFFYNVDRSQTKRWVDELGVVLEKTLGKAMVLPARKISSVKEFIERMPWVKEWIIDGTERPVQRPRDKRKQKECYSGKKKRHTKKHIVVAGGNKEILLLGKMHGGREHDYTMLKESKLLECIPKGIKTYVDLGFKGIEKDASLEVYIPFRKPKKRELNEEEKKFNTNVNRYRVKIENALSGVKRYRCITDVCRNKDEQLKDQLMWLCCGLWNFHLKTA